MLRLIYEKSSFFKAEIIRLIVENNGQINKNLLIKELYLSSATVNKYLQELHNELPDKALIISDSLIIFNYKNFSLYDVQKFYFSQSVVKDILHYCFFQPKLTFEQLAGKLYISHSKLFNILKFMDKNLENVGIYIQRRPYVILEGNLEAIMVLYNLCLQIEKQPFEKSFSKINLLDLQNRVVTFLDYYHMKAEYFVIRELCIWILTVHDRFYLQKVCKT
ncbi:helix-turn-helix domain-containing protein, partial [Enterococcus hirae]